MSYNFLFWKCLRNMFLICICIIVVIYLLCFMDFYTFLNIYLAHIVCCYFRITGLLSCMNASYYHLPCPCYVWRTDKIIFLQTLYFHIPVRHPSSYPELEVPTLLQVSFMFILFVHFRLASFPLPSLLVLFNIRRGIVNAQSCGFPLLASMYLLKKLIVLLIRFIFYGIFLSPPNDIFHAESLFYFFQSAALMSLGILYEGSAHPQTMQVLLVNIFLIFVCLFNA